MYTFTFMIDVSQLPRTCFVFCAEHRKKTNPSLMLNKYLFFAAGRVAHPLVECVVSTQQQQQQQQQQQPHLIAGFVPVLFEAPLLFPPAIHPRVGTTSPQACGGLHATQPLLSPPRPGDWVCACGFSNFASRMSCFGCQRPREKSSERGANTVKPGDWSCPCGTHNFARRTNCMTCDAPKPVSATYPNAMTHGERILPGDWLCSACNAHNFKSRGACVRCGEKKVMSSGDATALPVPWTCAACHTANPSSRRDCEICGVARPNEIHNNNGMNPSGGMTTPAPNATAASAPRAGDWSCPQCNFMNFAVRANCKNCTSARPAESGAPARAPAQELKKGDWTCSCGYHNFAKRVRCYGCQGTRPPTAASVEATE
jgi:hypothetical protein